MAGTRLTAPSGSGYRNFHFPSKSMRNLAEPGHSLKWMATELTAGVEVACKGWVVRSPSDFTVIKASAWNSLEALQQQQTRYFEEHRNDKRLKVTLGSHLKNMFVAIYMERKNKQEWYRAFVLEILTLKTGGEAVRAFLLDYGEKCNVLVDDVRRIPETILDAMPATAIKCCMSFEGEYASVTNWQERKAELDLFKALMEDVRYWVTFKFSSALEEGPIPVVWTCEVRLRQKGERQSRATADVEHLFYRMLSGITRDQVLQEADAGRGE